MKTVEDGDYVKLHYTGKFEGGEVFDSSRGCKPLEVQMGAGEVIKGFEQALRGMKAQETKTFDIKAADAYGERDDNLVQTFERSDFPDDFQAKEGDTIVLESEEQGQFPATITKLGSDEVIIDLNHPLAGRDLSFEVEVLEISDKPSEGACDCGCSCH